MKCLLKWICQVSNRGFEWRFGVLLNFEPCCVKRRVLVLNISLQLQSYLLLAQKELVPWA